MIIAPSWTQTSDERDNDNGDGGELQRQPLPSLNVMENCLDDDPIVTSSTSNNTSDVSSTFHVPPKPPLPPLIPDCRDSESIPTSSTSRRTSSLSPTVRLAPTPSLPPPAAAIGSDLGQTPSVCHKDPCLSEAAAKLLGKHVPDNTLRANSTAFFAFTEFVIEGFNLWISEKQIALKDRSTPPWKKKCLREEAVGLISICLFRTEDSFSLPQNTSLWTDKQLQRLNTVLIEFMATRKSQREDKDLSPSTLKSYVAGLQRALKERWGYDLNLFNGRVFSDPQKGLVTALDNKIRQQQALGHCRKSHNLLSEKNIYDLYASLELSMSHPRVYITRIICNVAIMTAFRKSELLELRVQDVTKVTEGEEMVIRIVGRIGSPDGASKTQSGGLKRLNSKPKEVYIWNRSQLNGSVNVYAEVSEYLELVSKIRKPHEKIFCAENYKAKGRENFFKAQNISDSTMVRYVTDAFKANKIVGVGERASMTMHGLRSTVITQLFRAGMGDSVSLRYGHRDPRSFQSYTNLRGTLGKRQQEGILGNFQENPTKRMASVSKGDAALSFGVRGSDEVCSEDKENCARNEVINLVEGEAVSTKFDAAVREPEVVLPSFLRNHGHFSGNVTINVDYGVGAGKIARGGSEK